MSDRRRLTRWAKSIQCSFDWDGRTYRGTATNISYSGMRMLDLAFLPPVNSSLILVLEREGAQVSVKGRVVYAKGISLGIEFEESRGALMKRLGSFFGEGGEA